MQDYPSDLNQSVWNPGSKKAMDQEEEEVPPKEEKKE